ncbi:MAG: ATP-binding cassette domain-containing protein [Desulfobulbus sp.]|nr:ATP-binding cassette domain-containing protein [Desulfobulbus sp.]
MPNLEVTKLCFQNRGPYSFRVKGGECMGLHGASGAGKSLLLRAIADLDPRTGSLSLGGVDADSISAPHWRKMVGLLPAESGWWLDLVGDHFQDFADIDEALLNQLGFDHSVKNWQVSRLSTGERQRMSILRLLHNKPSCLLLDEPTASLDQHSVAKAEQLFCSYGRDNQAPLIWVSHDPAQLDRVCSRKMTMEKGGHLLVPEEAANER